MHIHFIQLSTGGPHPQANIPILDICTYYNAKPPDIQCISIAGVHLAFMITYIDGPHDDTTFLNLWNWKSGRRLAEMAQAPKSSLLFIREDLLMVLNVKCLSFDIYCISVGTGDVQLIRSLLLPRLATKASLQFMIFNRLQNPIVWDPSSSFAQHGLQERPFVNDPLSALVCVDLRIKQTSGYEAIYGFVAPLGAFLAYSVEALDARKKAECPEERSCIITPIPWNFWGPQSTRWFPFRVNSTSGQIVRSPYGARCFLVLESGERPGTISQVTLLDFDKWRVRRARSHPPVLKTSCIPAGVFFSEPVVSYLPYLRKDVPRSLGSDGVKGDGNVNELKNLWAPMRINEQEIIRILVSLLKLEFCGNKVLSAIYCPEKQSGNFAFRVI